MVKPKNSPIQIPIVCLLDDRLHSLQLSLGQIGVAADAVVNIVALLAKIFGPEISARGSLSLGCFDLGALAGD